MAELRGLGEISAALGQAGGTVLAISADPPAKARQVALSNKLDFPVLSDASLEAIRAYGVLHAAGRAGRDIALPANFLIDRNGQIVWQHVARRVQDRAEPAEILRWVQSITRQD